MRRILIAAAVGAALGAGGHALSQHQGYRGPERVRTLSERDIAAMKKARTWRLMARLYFAAGRLRSAVKAPMRLLRDLSQRLRRRIRAL